MTAQTQNRSANAFNTAIKLQRRSFVSFHARAASRIRVNDSCIALLFLRGRQVEFRIINRHVKFHFHEFQR